MGANALSPSVMLATSMHSQPGVYAVLLGSGVSTGAGVLTGWGIVKELVRRAAAAAGAEAESQQLADEDPEAWWAEHGAGKLGYSSLLQALAPTAPARQGLLAEFFEPTDEERQEGVKVPSRAHHAIAQLVKRGLVRVIVTTGFDRLMEQALDAAGVAPQVVARPEAVNGMAPLAHSNATLIKLHGDYKDLGTRNTPEELSTYPKQWKYLLRQVFDEYGLIVCGWSAEWDTALVGHLESSANRRYPLYWDSRSSKGEVARRVIDGRGGVVMQTPGADELFGELVASLDALDRLSHPPLTAAMAVARLKRCLPDPVRRIELHDLVMDAAGEVASKVAEQPVNVAGNRLEGEWLEKLWNDHRDSVSLLTTLLISGIWHDPEGVHDALWVEVIQKLVDAGTAPLSSWTTGLDDARLWPALIASTATGVAAVRRNRDRVIIRLATEVRGRQRADSEAAPASQLLHPNRIFPENWVNAMPRWAGSRWLYPASHILKADLRAFFEETIPLQDDYVECFHGYEYRLGLIQEHAGGAAGRGYRALSGEYVGENAWAWGQENVPLAELAFRQAAYLGRDWPWPDFLGIEDIGGPDELDGVLVPHREVLKQYRRFR